MTNRPPTRAVGWWRLLLAALAAAVAVLLGAGTASAVTAPVLETRVGASTPATAYLVGVHESVSAGQRWAHAPPQAETVVATGVAAKGAADVGGATNKIYSARVLQRMGEEPGPMHNFPGSFDDTIFESGTRSVTPNFFNKAKPNLSNDSIQYRLPGEINGKSGTFEIFTRPSTSGRSELIMHRFFRPDY